MVCYVFAEYVCVYMWGGDEGGTRLGITRFSKWQTVNTTPFGARSSSQICPEGFPVSF